MKKLLLSTAALALLTLSVPSLARESTTVVCYSRTYFLVNVVNKNDTPLHVSFSGGNWPVADGEVPAGSLQGYAYFTEQDGCSYTTNKVLVTTGTITITGANGRPLCAGQWQHTAWNGSLGGQHDRFYLTMDSKDCKVSPSNNPADKNSGLHHNKSGDKDDTYTLTVQPS